MTHEEKTKKHVSEMSVLSVLNRQNDTSDMLSN